MHVRYRKQKQATKTKARLDTGKQEQANNTDIGYVARGRDGRGRLPLVLDMDDPTAGQP